MATDREFFEIKLIPHLDKKITALRLDILTAVSTLMIKLTDGSQKNIIKTRYAVLAAVSRYQRNVTRVMFPEAKRMSRVSGKSFFDSFILAFGLIEICKLT